MTKRQLKYLEAIKVIHEKNGVPPSLKELGGHLGVSQDKRSAVSHFVRRLCEAGFVKKLDTKEQYNLQRVELTDKGGSCL